VLALPDDAHDSRRSGVVQPVHGELSQRNGHRVLRVWGTPEEMGRAHGVLLRREILDIVDHYALPALGLDPSVVNTAGRLYELLADISPSLRAEAAAIVQGMQEAGGAHSEVLGRDLLPRDLLVLNAMTDLLTIGCSSVSAWGEATASSDLSGAPAMVRNLDWSEEPALLRNQVLIVFEPAGDDRQAVVSVAFAGYIGCLTCMNAAGVVGTFNMGYGDGAAAPGEAMQGFAPANLLLRDAIERVDVDADERSTAADVERALREADHAGSYIVHVLDELGPARVLEVEADGVVARGPKPHGLGAHVLAATNHFRAKVPPRPGRRYARVQRELADSPLLGRDELWGLGVALRRPDVVHTALFEPRARRIRLWIRGENESARHPDSSSTWSF